MTSSTARSNASWRAWPAEAKRRLLARLSRAAEPPCGAALLAAAGMTPDPWQAEFLATRHARTLLVAARQCGKSQTASAYALAEALAVPESFALILSPTLRQSGECFREKVLPLWRAAGRPLYRRDPTQLELHLANGSRLLSLPDSEGNVRGFSGVTLLLIDEASRVDDDLYKAVRPMLATKGGALIALSTPFGQRGWFHEAWAHGQGWHKVSVPASHCPRLTPEFLADERLNLGGIWYRQEYECQFVAVEGAEWPPEYFTDRIWFDEWPHPDTVVRSVLSVDTSKGVLKGDYQAFTYVVLDKNAHFWVDGAAERLDEERLLHRAIDLITQWQPTYVVVETNGAGFYLLGQLARAIIRGVRVPVLGRHHGAQVSKEARICARLGSQFARGTIHLKRGSAAMEMLRRQAMDFPEAEYDDMLDSLEQGLELHGELCKPKLERRVRYEIPAR